MEKEYTTYSRCSKVADQPPPCPLGWESVGTTKPGSCQISDVPGNGHYDQWRLEGHMRVCKKKVQSSGNLDVDCCSNVGGIANSAECRANGTVPYSDTCNNIMQNRCNETVRGNPYGPDYRGCPLGTGQKPKIVKGTCDEHCRRYIRNAPANSFYHNHDYKDYPRHFPKASYVTPAFDGGWGYTPMRTPYLPYHTYQHKPASNVCRNEPQKCWNTASRLKDCDCARR